jgi:hypothetical protein
MALLQVPAGAEYIVDGNFFAFWSGFLRHGSARRFRRNGTTKISHCGPEVCAANGGAKSLYSGVPGGFHLWTPQAGD